MDRVRASDAINELRAELTRALEQGATERVQFDVGPIELELELEFSAGAGVKAETKWWVVSAGAEATGKRTTTHRLKLTLSPRQQGGKLRIAARTRTAEDTSQEAATPE